MLEKRKIKVVVATEYPFDTSRIRGGIESVSFHFVRALSLVPNLEVHVVSFSEKISQNKIEFKDNTCIHWIKHGLNIRGIRTLRLLTTDVIKLKRVFNKINPDIIHVQNFSGYILACNSSKYKIITSIHGLEALTSFVDKNPYYKGFAGRLRVVVERFLALQSVKKSDYLVSNSGSYAPSVLEGVAPKEKFEYIDHLVGDEFFPLWTKTPDKEFVVLSIASISERKRTLDLVVAIKNISKILTTPVKLVLLGPIVDQLYYDSLVANIERWGLNDIITIKTNINQDLVIRSCVECSVFSICSDQETAPMAIIAAMSVGRPIVATNVGGISNLVSEDLNGYLFTPGDIENLTSLLLRISTCSNYLGEQSRIIAESRFSKNIVIEKFKKLYYKAVS